MAAARPVSTVPVQGLAARTERNITLDVLRGLCIVMMITGHVGTNTYLNHSVHFLRFVSGAEGFVFLSGLVLGLVYRRRIAAGVARAYGALWRRALTIWLVHVALVMVGTALNGRMYYHADIPPAAQFGTARFVWLTATLQLQPGHALNILPLYVVLLGVAPLAFELLRRRLSLVLLAASVGGLVFVQYQPDAVSFVHESCGDAFPPLAWQGLFFPGLCVGYHYRFLRDRLVTPHRRLLLYGLTGLCAAAVVAVWVQTPAFEFYDHARWDLTLWNRHPLRLGRVAYFMVSIAALYLLAQAAMRRGAALGSAMQPLALLGRNSLYSFITHIAIAVPLTGVVAGTRPGALSEAVTALSVVAVYLLARYQVGRPLIPN